MHGGWRVYDEEFAVTPVIERAGEERGVLGVAWLGQVECSRNWLKVGAVERRSCRTKVNAWHGLHRLHLPSNLKIWQ
jgi:hypothetical protein